MIPETKLSFSMLMLLAWGREAIAVGNRDRDRRSSPGAKHWCRDRGASTDEREQERRNVTMLQQSHSFRPSLANSVIRFERCGDIADSKDSVKGARRRLAELRGASTGGTIETRWPWRLSTPDGACESDHRCRPHPGAFSERAFGRPVGC